MEKIKNKIFYQVAVNQNYKVGQLLEFNKETNNGQYYKTYTANSKFKDGRAADCLFKLINKKLRFLKKDDCIKLAHILDDYDVAMRDLAIEQVRKELYPEYPSRLHCMYLSNDKQTAIDNLNNFVKRDGKGCFQIVAVKCIGNIFKVEKNVERAGCSFEEYLAKAKEFWQQKNIKNPNAILFEGVAEIVEIIKEVNI